MEINLRHPAYMFQVTSREKALAKNTLIHSCTKVQVEPPPILTDKQKSTYLRDKSTPNMYTN